MTNEIQVKGTVSFMGKEIPKVFGGFGEDKPVLLAKTIAKIHERDLFKVNELINNNIEQFNIEGATDLIDLISILSKDSLLEFGFTKQSIANSKNIYLLSERGYKILIKAMEDDMSWEVYHKLLNEYFNFKEQQQFDLSKLSPELIMFKTLWDGLAKTQLIALENQTEIKEAKQEIKQVQNVVDDIRETIVQRDDDWRDSINQLIKKAAKNLGGRNDDFVTVRRESYELLQERASCRLKQRVKNIQDRMREQGIRETDVKKANNLDAIEADKKLKEIYFSIVKELSIKYGNDKRVV
ncbi:hypothetical protein BC351_10415 [Paenibacillus ferrarius]|uniref:KilA-N DNA-binding domain-containing protein n=1 Tax=Paenibacillus ferrarius TaxID=1469647 RepID=A0A1V4H904_9BACL|nr:hypothetical protein [Paenibacillus ferrarius]OPH47596.1 hypothetical protein BC351_10415 [Paenibacillus ferrarius]